MSEQTTVLVTGAGGFIGHHLTKYLVNRGYRVRGVDIKEPQYEPTAAHEFALLDLRFWENCLKATEGVDEVYGLAANMGGIGFIESHKAEIVRDSSLINLHSIEAARQNGVKRYLFTSSACVYPGYLQKEADVTPLKEEDAYPADAEDGYGWEKLYMERVCRHYREDYGLETRIVRFHNMFGPCFDEQTEILTVYGFKHFRDITYTDKVATLNPKTGRIEYHRPLAIQRYRFDGEMVKIKQQRVNLLITPNHSVYYAPGWGSEFKLDEIQNLLHHKSLYFSRRCEWSTDAAPEFYTLRASEYSDGRQMSARGAERQIPLNLWLVFLGWYLSEGCAFRTPSNHTVVISQSPGQYQNEIVELLREMGFEPYVNGKNIIISSKQLYNAVTDFGHATDKYIPREFLMLPKDKLQILYETLMKGDGNATGRRYSTVSKQLADDFQELALKLGYGVSIRVENPQNENHSVMYRLNISRETVHRIDTDRITKEEYHGTVYDVTVPNHIILVRRNGKVIWSGNCGTYDGGREKSPAAICRKIALAEDGDAIEVWGDGGQTRSYCYVDDCVEGIHRLMRSDYTDPLNLGQDRMISINELVDIVARIAGKTIRKNYDLTKPQGVRGRNSDNTRLREVLGWEPSVSLEDGLARTYQWIAGELKKKGTVPTTLSTVGG